MHLLYVDKHYATKTFISHLATRATTQQAPSVGLCTLFTGMLWTCLMVMRDPCRARLIVVVDTRGFCGHAIRTTSFIRFSVMVYYHMDCPRWAWSRSRSSRCLPSKDGCLLSVRRRSPPSGATSQLPTMPSFYGLSAPGHGDVVASALVRFNYPLAFGSTHSTPSRHLGVEWRKLWWPDMRSTRIDTGSWRLWEIHCR